MWWAVPFLSWEDAHITIAKQASWPLKRCHRQASGKHWVSGLHPCPLNSLAEFSPNGHARPKEDVSKPSQPHAEQARYDPMVSITQKGAYVEVSPTSWRAVFLARREQRCQNSLAWPTWTFSTLSLSLSSRVIQISTAVHWGRKYENGKLGLSGECVLCRRKYKPERDRCWRIRELWWKISLGM